MLLLASYVDTFQDDLQLASRVPVAWRFALCFVRLIDVEERYNVASMVDTNKLEHMYRFSEFYVLHCELLSARYLLQHSRSISDREEVCCSSYQRSVGNKSVLLTLHTLY